MSDMADMALDQMMNMDELQCSCDTFEDALDLGVEELLYNYDGSRQPHVFAFMGGGQQVNKTCRCCGESGLHWRKVRGKWLLFAGSSLHDCPVNPLLDK